MSSYYVLLDHPSPGVGSNLAGNAIDFFVEILGLSFHDAMRQITGG